MRVNLPAALATAAVLTGTAAGPAHAAQGSPDAGVVAGHAVTGGLDAACSYTRDGDLVEISGVAAAPLARTVRVVCEVLVGELLGWAEASGPGPVVAAYEVAELPAVRTYVCVTAWAVGHDGAETYVDRTCSPPF